MGFEEQVSLAAALSVIVLLASPQSASAQATEDAASTAPAPVVAVVPSEPSEHSEPKFIAVVGLALPVFVYAEPQGKPSLGFTPLDRLQSVQTVALGYAVNPRVNVFVSGLFLETLTTNAGKTGFTIGGITAFLTYRPWKRLFVGVGPAFFYREYLAWENDYGAFYTVGYNFQLPAGFGLITAANSVHAYKNRPFFANAIAVALAHRF